jgi:hypothetical protein
LFVFGLVVHGIRGFTLCFCGHSFLSLWFDSLDSSISAHSWAYRTPSFVGLFMVLVSIIHDLSLICCFCGMSERVFQGREKQKTYVE